MTTDTPQLGLVHMSNDEYHAAPGISSSHLNAVASQSLRHYWHKYRNPNREPEKASHALQLGTAIHTAILEPDELHARVIIGLEIQRRSNADKAEWAAYEAAHAGKIILSASDHQKVLDLRDAFYRHPVAPGLLTAGRAEQSIFAEELIETTNPYTGEVVAARELIKCQPDYARDSGDYIVDVKSTLDASPTGFAKSCANYRYPVQAAWYRRVLDAAFGGHHDRWIWIAFEPEPPHAIGIYWADTADLVEAAAAADRDFMRIVGASRADVWPDYGYEPQALVLPGWSRM